MKKEKIGIAVITCNREEFCRTCVNSIDESWYDELIVVNDGVTSIELEGYDVTRTYGAGVCKAKNKAFNKLLAAECDHIFIVEDDMKFKGNCFDEYINTSKRTGIKHFMFGYHGPANKGGISGGKPCPRKIIDYGKGVIIALNMHCVGAVCYYTRDSLEKVGLFDEKFDRNNFEHVDHSYQLAKAGYSTPYWWWADLANSTDYIEEQACSEVSSSIRSFNPKDDKTRFENIKYSAQYFKEKNGVLPAWHECVPDTPIGEVLEFLTATYKQNKKHNEDIATVS